MINQFFTNRTQLIFTSLFLLVFISNSRAESGLINDIDSNLFSRRVFVLSIGINDYKAAHLPSLQFCESDANNFVERIKKDSSFTEVHVYKILGKEATKEKIKESFISISKIAGPHDLFIFFDASLGWRGSVILSDSSTISSVELYAWSQAILTTRQLYYLDICAGDKFTGQLKKHIMQKPDLSALCKQDRVVLSVPGNAMEYSSVQGGLFTMAYVRNKTAKILDIFSKSNRTKTEFLYNLYNGDIVIKEINRLEIEYFSEREFYSSMIEEEKSRSATLLSDPNESESNKKTVKKGETLCLLIGVKDYEFINTLSNTLNDAREIKAALSDKYLTKIIYLENPTYEEFKLKLVEIQNEYKFEDGSQMLFFAAAHGGKNELGEGCLLLKDCKTENGILKNAMALTSLKRFIGQLNCTNSIILLDICHSGTMFEEEACVKPAAIEIPKTNKIYNEKLAPGTVAYKNFLNQKTKMFIGSSNDQEAADGKGKHSPFATVVLGFLNDNTLPVTDSYYLRQSIEKNIMAADAISIPQFCMYGGCKDDGRFLFFIK